MPRRASAPLLTRLAAEVASLRQLELDLRAHGDNELADVAKRALREFQHPNYTSAINTLGVDARAVRG